MHKDVYDKVAEVLATSRNLEELSDVQLKCLIFRFQTMFGMDSEQFDAKKFSKAVYDGLFESTVSHGF